MLIGLGPPVQGPYFNDVPNGSFAADWINELYANGVTNGCGSGDYCPDASVTRAQMAVPVENPGPLLLQLPLRVRDFRRGAPVLVRRQLHRGPVLPRNHRRLQREPAALLDSPVNRGQMATFLVRTFLTL